MVLHNSKWDRRAKGKYLKKHGLKADQVGKPKVDAPVHNAVGTDEIEGRTVSTTTATTAATTTDASDTPDAHVSSTESTEGDPLVTIDLPELENDDEEEKLIRRHIERQKKEYLEKQAAAAAAQPKVDPSVIAQAEKGSARSKLNEQVRKHIGRNVKQIELDSDSSFDEFMDNLSDDEPEDAKPAVFRPAAKVDLNEKQRELLDGLLK